MKTMFFQLGMVVIGGAALLIWETGPWELPDVSRIMGRVTAMAPAVPVTVVLLPDTASVKALRESVDPARVVASTGQAFAVAEGRIFATSIEAASEPINLAGWAGRPIELRDPAGQRKPGPAEIQARREEAGAREDSLRELARKRELTQGDAMRLLQEMERHGDL